MYKFYIAAIILSISGNLALYGMLNIAQSESKMLQTALDIQNQRLLDIRLETEKYACSLDSLNTYTRIKYENVTHEADTCEAKLAEFEKALGIYAGE